MADSKKYDSYALVLSGGGARGAYQAGVLKYIGENIPDAHFGILVGSSSGAINAAGLASFGGELATAGPQIANLWKNLKIYQVFRVDVFSLVKIGAKWLHDLIFGGVIGKPLANSLVDTKPLSKLLEKIIKPDVIRHSLATGNLRSIALTATEVYTGASVTFVQSENFTPWERARRRSEPAVITSSHVMASSAIPFLFPSVLVGYRQYVDGCIRANAPLGPAARLGAKKILAIGVRKSKKHVAGGVDATRPAKPEAKATIARLAALVLTSLFSEGLDSDSEHLVRLNKIVDKVGQSNANLDMKKIDLLVVRPSRDLGRLASHFHQELPNLVRYLLRGLGGEKGDAGDMLSYLLFTPGFTSKLIELGYNDAKAMDAEIRAFFQN